MKKDNLPAKLDENVDKNQKGVALLNKVYEYAINGVPHVSEPLNNLVYSYLSKSKNVEEAIDKFIHYQKIKCSTTGFITGLGGLITLPVTLTTDIASSLYIEMRMIAAIAIMRGYNINDDQVKTLVFLCMAGNAIGDVVKQAGIKTLEKYTVKKLLPKLTRDVIVKINQKVGFRLITKGGSKGIINVAKTIPLFGGGVGAVWNWVEVSSYAKYAKKMFNVNR